MIIKFKKNEIRYLSAFAFLILLCGYRLSLDRVPLDKLMELDPTNELQSIYDAREDPLDNESFFKLKEVVEFFSDYLYKWQEYELTYDTLNHVELELQGLLEQVGDRIPGVGYYELRNTGQYILTNFRKQFTQRLIRDLKKLISDGEELQTESFLPQTIVILQKLAQEQRFLGMKSVQACIFAMKNHGKDSQTYDGYPYMYHLKGVAQEVRCLTHAFGDHRFHTLAYLHDIVEDTDVDVEELLFEFGQDVFDHVLALTNLKKEDYPNKLLRKKLTYKQIAEDPIARLVKVADRLHNLKTGASRDPLGIESKLNKYKNDKQFFEELYNPDDHEVVQTMWSELMLLLYDEEYRRKFTLYIVALGVVYGDDSTTQFSW